MTTPVVSLVWDNTEQEADLAVDANGMLDTAEGFTTAVNISLFTWARDDKAEIQQTGQKFGWWGDTYADTAGDRIGSKLWTLRRAKVNQDTLGKAKAFCIEALTWMVEDGIAKAVDVTTERLGLQIIKATISITRQQGGKWTGVWEVHLNAL
jgi:phage gp46-like protein